MEVRTHSGLHVLKGAVIAVLGPCKTGSVHVSDGHGVLSVQLENKPTSEEIMAIERAANRKISENAEVLEFEMERLEAEGHFGTAIYDAFPVQTTGRLKIVRIPEWEVNCCAETHIDTTGELIGLRIDGIRYRKAKQLLDIEFHLVA